MKIKLIVILILCTISLFTAESIIKIDDDAGDDYGHGKVIYPEDPMYAEGIFDITSFEILENEDDYEFIISINGELNPVNHDEFQYNYNLGDNFYLPMIHIYLDQDHVDGSGFTTTINGTNAFFNSENAWEKVVVIASLPERFAGDLKRAQPEIAHNAIIPYKYKVSRTNDAIITKIAKKEIGEISPQWGFSVLMLCQEFSQTIEKSVYIKDIKSTSSMTNFGGGSGNFLGNYDPNIIDMILPLSKNQKKVLSNFDNEEKRYVELYAYYPQFTAIKKNESVGSVKQVSESKIVIDIGSDMGVEIGSQLLVDNRVVVIVTDVFPNLSIAEFNNSEDWITVEEGMKVNIKK